MNRKGIIIMTKQEKEILTTEYGKVYSKEDMIKYSVNKVSDIVTVNDGIVVIEKPSIRTEFCFGYHTVFCDDYDDKVKCADKVSSNEDYFIQKNLEWTDFDIWLEILKTNSYDFHNYVVFIADDYKEKISMFKQAVYANESYFDTHYDSLCYAYKGLRKITAEERQALINGYESAKAKFVKRLNTYLKKYGLSKVNTHIYWADE